MCEIEEEIRREGRLEGRLEALKEAALNLRRMGLAPELIAQAVGKSVEQLQVLLGEV